jgi:alkylation response protein AidB-like acyl-CoA dehydrogenase
VRITCIYEGTSEIMEWTIARDRWQQHLKTRGEYYREWAARAGQGRPEDGADVAMLALQALAVILERCRLDKLTRSQHVLFRLGELIAWAETAAVFAERVAAKPTEAIALDVPTRRALARVYARQAALKVAADGLALTVGAGQSDPNLAAALNLPAIYQAQAGLIADMDFAVQELNKSFGP